MKTKIKGQYENKKILGNGHVYFSIDNVESILLLNKDLLPFTRKMDAVNAKIEALVSKHNHLIDRIKGKKKKEQGSDTTRKIITQLIKLNEKFNAISNEAYDKFDKLNGAA